MRTVLILGSAPRLESDLAELRISDFEFVCGINQVFLCNIVTLYRRFGVHMTHYFTTDWFLKSHPNAVSDLDVPKKIVVTPKHLHKPDLSSYKDLKHCPDDVVSRIDVIGGFPFNKWATTGIYALGYFLIREAVDFAVLAGFTFGEGKLHFYDDSRLDWPHSPSYEKQIYAHFHREGRCARVGEYGLV